MERAPQLYLGVLVTMVINHFRGPVMGPDPPYVGHGTLNKGSCWEPGQRCKPTRNGLVEWLHPPKFNMESENTPLEKEKHLPNHHFQVLC